MARSTIFRNNTTQAVRLPKDVALPDTVRQVDVSVSGRARVIVPVGSGWDHWFDHGEPVPDDFMAERDQPEAQEREAW
ncbi:MAG: type II toxin-antitoxin system VapB family antitoxin [Aeromicrobium sp.]|uniref:type II toxin-antitoxin system VapB family antitoxin n=1 Tax=Aeromicrobium sp. TaxID=1871063 RepID=UPI0039E2155B